MLCTRFTHYTPPTCSHCASRHHLPSLMPPSRLTAQGAKERWVYPSPGANTPCDSFFPVKLSQEPCGAQLRSTPCHIASCLQVCCQWVADEPTSILVETLMNFCGNFFKSLFYGRYFILIFIMVNVLWLLFFYGQCVFMVIVLLSRNWTIIFCVHLACTSLSLITGRISLRF